MRRAFAIALTAVLAAPALALAQPAPAPQPQQHAAPAAAEAPRSYAANIGPAYIEPQNPLERSFLAAMENPEQRAAFRRLFLDSQVALALSSSDPEAPPRQIDLPRGAHACLIFTSAARANAVMGGNAPVVMMSGREALTRVRGANVIININLRPFLTLDAASVDELLALPPTPARPRSAPAAPPASGPTQ